MTANNNILNFFATSPKGLELLLVDELKGLGAASAAEKLAGVAFTGDLAVAYKACLWSRFANRILLHLATVPAKTPEELYAGVQSIAWDQHLNPEGTLAVQFVTSQSAITHTLFGAQKVKDAVVDQLREKFGTRPSVDRETPDVSIYIYLHRDQAAISIDLSGESLHRRGYRLKATGAPLKENLAAAILTRAGWPAIAKSGGSLLDPMCGSGTLLVEAALMAGDIAPGFMRDYYGFLGWKQHDKATWQALLSDAKERAEKGLESIPTIIGYDEDPEAIKVAFDNIECAGLLGKIHVEKHPLDVFTVKSTVKPGIVVTNPPYGERLGEVEALAPLYTLLGDQLKNNFFGWKAAVFTGNPDLGKQMGLRSYKNYAFYNGAIACKLFLFDVAEMYFVDRSPAADNERRFRKAKRTIDGNDLKAAEMFVNRLQKNVKHLRKKAEKEGLTRYAIYDADLPEYAFLIELEDDKVIVQEYLAPKEIPSSKVTRRREAVLAVLPEALAVEPSAIYYSQLPRRKGDKI